MMIFWKQRLVMLAVPKTGSTAYEKALGPLAGLVVRDPPELKHAPVYRYNRFFRPMMDKMGAAQMDVLAVVREPVDWLGSWYRYRQRAFLDGKPTSTSGMGFETFVEAYLGPERPPFANVGSQAKFVEPRPNGTQVTHLFKYENQTGLIAFLEERLDTTLDLAHSNVSPRRDLGLSPETDARLRDLCAEDFAIWEKAR